MTTYRLWPSTNGGSLVSYGGPFVGATQFGVYGGGNWITGVYIWVPASGDTSPSGGYNTALYSLTTVAGGGAGALVPGSVVTGVTGLTANAWNFIAFSTPLQLAPSWDKNSTANGSSYVACVGWTASAGFADTNNYWASGGSGGNGITNGPLIGYSSNSGASNKAPWGMAQGLFGDSTSNAAAGMPNQTSGTDNFWVDVQVSNTAPGGYTGSYVCPWPNKFDANEFTTGDAAFNYDICTEISLSQACTLNSIRYFSPAAATTLATKCTVWSVSSQTLVASITSPSWQSVRTGSAFTAGTTPDGTSSLGTMIKAAFPGGVTLPAGDYRVGVYNSNGTTDANWSPKDANTDYWGETATNSAGAAGITWGPMTAPGWSTSSSGWLYNNADGGNTPPYGQSAISHTQPPFGQLPGGGDTFPLLYAPVGGSSNQTQNYWVSLEATPIVVGIAGLGGSVRGRPGRKGSSAGSKPVQVRIEEIPPVSSGRAITGRKARKGTAAGSPQPLVHREDVPAVPSGTAVRGKPGRKGSAQGSRLSPVVTAVITEVPPVSSGRAVTGRKVRKGSSAGSPAPQVRPEILPAASGASVRGKPGRKGSSSGSKPVLVSPVRIAAAAAGAVVRGRPGRKGAAQGSRPLLVYVPPAPPQPPAATGRAVTGRRGRRGSSQGSPYINVIVPVGGLPLEQSLLGGTITPAPWGGTVTTIPYSGTISGGIVGVQNDLQAVVNNDEYYYLAITYNSAPLNLTGYTPKAYLKAQRTTPDSDAVVFTTSSGLTVTSASGGLVTWDIPHAELPNPTTLWYRFDVIDASNEVFTVMYGNLQVLPA